MVEDRSLAGRIFSIINYLLLTIIGIVIVYPFLACIGRLLYDECRTGRQTLRHHPGSMESRVHIEFIFSTNTITRAMLVSIGMTLIGTAFSMFLTSLTAYGLARKDLDGRRLLCSSSCLRCCFMAG